MEQRAATILFADLRGFSGIAGTYPPELVFGLLNDCFIRLSEIAARHRGTVDKFMGDSIMVVFFDEPGSPGEHARRGVHCAVDMQIGMDQANSAKRDTIRPELYMGIGINTGEVIAGVLGSEIYSARTVIGEAVNHAARIEAFCLRGQILVSEQTLASCVGFVETGSPMEVYVKGAERPLALHEIHGIPGEGKKVPRQERRRSPRVQVRFPFTYQVLANDVVSQVRAKGTVLDIGYRGVQVELERELGLYEEFKLDLDLPVIGYRASDLYGRIVNAKRTDEGTRYGVEFTSFGVETSSNIRKLVHLLMQGTESH
jgi:adenylate cyclase